MLWRTAMPALRSFPLTLLDVFAAGPLQGNLHAVVHDADTLADDTMGAFARRIRLSETSFVQSSDRDDADYWHRIYTVSGEIPFAGHPSLGTATAVALASGAATADYTQLTGAGLQRLHVELDVPAQCAEVELEQNPPELLGQLEAGPLLAAIGLGPDDADPALSPWVVSTGLPTAVLPVRGEDVLGRARPDLRLVQDALAGPPAAVTLYVVARAARGRWRARCFTPAVAGGEDAATGSAAGPLAAYTAAFAGESAIDIDQGVEMGSPSQLSARCDAGRVVVAGRVHIVGGGNLRLPARPQ